MSDLHTLPLVVWRTRMKTWPTKLQPFERINKAVMPDPEGRAPPHSGYQRNYEMIAFLNQQEVLHHYEYIPGEWPEMILFPERSLDPVHAIGYAVVLHLYEENTAFDVRMRFNVRLLDSDWRERFRRLGSVRPLTST